MGFFQQSAECERLTELEKKLGSAKIKGKKKCIMCGFCCHKRTCIPTPSELKEIAKFLKLSPKELINKYYAVDSGHIEHYYVKPVGENTKDLAGEYIPADRTFNEGKCIFLGKGNKCKIYSVRPKEARLMKCWEPESSNGHKKDLTKSWSNNALLKEFGIDGEELEKEDERGD